MFYDYYDRIFSYLQNTFKKEIIYSVFERAFFYLFSVIIVCRLCPMQLSLPIYLHRTNVDLDAYWFTSIIFFKMPI